MYITQPSIWQTFKKYFQVKTFKHMDNTLFFSAVVPFPPPKTIFNDIHVLFILFLFIQFFDKVTVDARKSLVEKFTVLIFTVPKSCRLEYLLLEKLIKSGWIMCWKEICTLIHGLKFVMFMEVIWNEYKRYKIYFFFDTGGKKGWLMIWSAINRCVDWMEIFLLW